MLRVMQVAPLLLELDHDTLILRVLGVQHQGRVVTHLSQVLQSLQQTKSVLSLLGLEITLKCFIETF